MNKKEKFVKKYVKKGKSADYGLKRYRKYNDYLKHKNVDKLPIFEKKLFEKFKLGTTTDVNTFNHLLILTIIFELEI